MEPGAAGGSAAREAATSTANGGPRRSRAPRAEQPSCAGDPTAQGSSLLLTAHTPLQPLDNEQHGLCFRRQLEVGVRGASVPRGPTRSQSERGRAGAWPGVPGVQQCAESRERGRDCASQALHGTLRVWRRGDLERKSDEALYTMARLGTAAEQVREKCVQAVAQSERDTTGQDAAPHPDPAYGPAYGESNAR